MNTTGNWSDPQLWDSGRIPFTVNLGGWRTKVSHMGLPDVFSEEFAANCDEAAARQCSERQDIAGPGVYRLTKPEAFGKAPGLLIVRAGS